MAHEISLKIIRSHNPSNSCWKNLLSGLEFEEHRCDPEGNITIGYDPERKITIGFVSRINGVEDALWCLRCLADKRTIVRAVLHSAIRVSTLTKDVRVVDCVAAIKSWLAGNDDADLASAAAAAREASALSAADAESKKGWWQFADISYVADAAALAAEAVALTADAARANSAVSAAALAARAAEAAARADERRESAVYRGKYEKPAITERERQGADLIAQFGISTRQF